MAKYKGIQAGSTASRQVKANRTAVQRKSKAKAAFMKSKDKARGLSSITNLAGSVAKLGATLAPNLQEWDAHEKGREEVGLERTDKDLSLWDKLGRLAKGPEMDGSATIWEGAGKSKLIGEGGDTFGEERGHTYSHGELKRIGMESMAGTLKQTLAGREMSDMFGSHAGKRLADPLSYEDSPYDSIGIENQEPDILGDIDMGNQETELAYQSTLKDNYNMGMRADLEISRQDSQLSNLRDTSINPIDDPRMGAMVDPGRPESAPIQSQEAEALDDDAGSFDLEDGTPFELQTLPERSDSLLGNATLSGGRATQADIDKAMAHARESLAGREGEWGEAPPLVEKNYEDLPMKDKVGSYLMGQDAWQSSQNKIYNVTKDTGDTFEGHDIKTDAPSLFGDIQNAWDSVGRGITGSNSLISPWEWNRKMPWSE
jgi:hypothetical protein